MKVKIINSSTWRNWYNGQIGSIFAIDSSFEKENEYCLLGAYLYIDKDDCIELEEK